MIRTQCVRCGLPAEVDYPEDVIQVRCSECSGKLAAVWAPPESPEAHEPVRRGRFSRPDHDRRASFRAPLH